MNHKWGTPDILLGRAYRFCEVCGAAQHADGAVRQFRYQSGIADYVRSRPRWVYEGEATAECPGEGNDADIRLLDEPEASCPHCGSVMTCYEEYGDDDATGERVIVYRCDECGGLWEYEMRRRPEVQP